MQDTSALQEIGPDETLVCGEPFEGCRRSSAQGVVREALMRTDEGSEWLRHGEGAQDVWPGQLLLQMVGEPWLGCMLLTLGAMTMATGMMDMGCCPTAVALRAAVSRVSAPALLDGADDLAVCHGEGGG